MRQFAILIAVGMSCAGCVAGPPPTQIAETNVAIAPDDANCRVWTTHARIDSDFDAQTLVGRGCRRPDRAWQVTEGTPNTPRGYQQRVSAATAAQYPWYSGPPVGISIGRPLVLYDFIQHPERLGKH